MAREEEVEGVIKSIVLAPRTILDWDPETNDGMITFQTARYASVNSVVRTDLFPPARNTLPVATPISGIATRRFVPPGMPFTNDPVTGADLSQISVAGVMTIIKAAFDTLYAEQHE